MDESISGSRSVAHAELLRGLARVYLDPLIELAGIARMSLGGPRLDDQLNAWAAKWHLEPLREIAEVHVHYWAGTTHPAAPLLLMPPSTPPVAIPRERLESLMTIEVEWSPTVVWEPIERLISR